MAEWLQKELIKNIMTVNPKWNISNDISTSDYTIQITLTLTPHREMERQLAQLADHEWQNRYHNMWIQQKIEQVLIIGILHNSHVKVNM